LPQRHALGSGVGAGHVAMVLSALKGGSKPRRRALPSMAICLPWLWHPQGREPLGQELFEGQRIQAGKDSSERIHVQGFRVEA